MKTKAGPVVCCALLISNLHLSHHAADAQGTAFTYQGRLNNNGVVANGWYDLQFAIHDGPAGGSQVGGSLSANAVTVTLDFGARVVRASSRALPTAVPSPNAPMLTIVPATPGSATIWWTPATPGFLLQENTNLATTNWVNLPSGASNPVTVPATQPALFHRLFIP